MDDSRTTPRAAMGAALALAALVGWCGAAAAQEEINIELDARPISAPAATPAATAAPKVVVAPIADATGAFQANEDRALLDSTLRSSFSEQEAAGYSVVDLLPPPEPCDRARAVSRARLNETPYLVFTEIRQFTGAYVATIEIVRVVDAQTARTIQTGAVDSPAALLAELKAAATRAATALSQIIRPTQPPPASPASAAIASAHAAGGWGAGAVASDPVAEQEAVATYRSRRNAGIAVFAISIPIAVFAGVLIGIGEAEVNEGLFWGGIAVAVVSEVMFWTGIGAWIANQIRMNKTERGIQLGRGLRLDGLAPFVASRERGEAGLAAVFSF
jgi:hypothetical protein